MRVIAGTAKRLQLKTLDGMETRPTTDRIKETLFNMIAPSVFGSVFLDLFAGSGGIGIEALSRGAKEAVFVEKNPKAMACVKENLNYTKLSEKAMTMTKDVLTALYQLEGEKVFDFVFMDAAKAQYINFLPQVLRLMKKGAILITDNVLQEGDLIESKFVVRRRDRTIHKRMREYMEVVKNHPELETSIVPIGDGITMSVKK